MKRQSVIGIYGMNAVFRLRPLRSVHWVALRQRDAASFRA